MAVVFSNNAATNLASNVSASATTISVVDGSVFPDVSGGHYTYLTLHDLNDNIEIVKLTARSGNTLTVDRGHDGTTGRSFVAGDKCELRITAVLLNEIASQADTDTNTEYTAGSGLNLSGTTFTNTAPDQTVSLTGSGATTISGTYPNFTISSTDTNTDTNTTYTAGSGLSLTGTTFANTAPDQTVSLTGSGATTISGTYPNFTISSTDTTFSTSNAVNFTNTFQLTGVLTGGQQGFVTWTNDDLRVINAKTIHQEDTTYGDVFQIFHSNGSGSDVNISKIMHSGNNLTPNGRMLIQSLGNLDLSATGTISIRKFGSAPYDMIKAIPDGAVELFYNNSKVAETVSGGFTVTGELAATGGNSTNWNTAYGWGDHGSAGYLTSHQSLSGYATETYVGNQITALVDSSPAHLNTLGELATAIGNNASGVTALTNSIATKWTQDNTKISQWDTAYGWGNHASAGYLTSYSETDTLATVTARGNSTSSDIDLNSANILIDNGKGFSNSGSWTRNTTPYGYIEFGPANTSWAHIYTDRNNFYFNRDLYAYNNLMWHAGNDGSGSGLDADLLDGQHGSYYQNASNINSGTLNTARLPSAITVSGKIRTTAGALQFTSADHQLTSHNAQNVLIKSGTTSAMGLLGQNSSDQFRWQLYGDGSHYGFLDGSWSSWDIKKTINGAFQVDEGSGLKRVLNEANWSSYITVPSVGNGTLSITTSGSVSGGGSFTANQSGNTTLNFTGNGIMQGSNAVGNGSFSNAIGAGFRFQRVTGGSNRFYTSHHNVLQIPNTSGDQYLAQMAFGTGDTRLGWRSKSTTFGSWYEIWHSGNDGSGSGLDADLLDGQQGSYYAPASSIPTTLPANGGNAATVTMSANRTDSTEYPIVWGTTGGTSQLYSCSATRIRSSDGTIFSTHYRGSGNVHGTGEATHHPAGIYSQGTNWLYGNIIMNNNAISNLTTINGGTPWTSSNDGSSSGLDADLLDGQDGSYYAPASSIPSVGNGTLTVQGAGSVSGSGTFTANQSGNNTITLTGATIPTSLPANGGNADTVDGVHATGFTRFYNNAVLTSSENTANFIAELISDYGCFQSNSVTLKIQWSYSGSSDLVTGHATIGTIELAGCTIETWGGTYKHIRITRPNTGAGGHMVVEYNDQSSSYAPAWREIWTSESDGPNSGLDADKLDSQEGSYYLNYNNFSNTPSIPSSLPANGGNSDTVDNLHAASFARSDASDTIGNGVQWNWASTDTAGLKFTNSSYGKSLEIGGWTSTNTAGISRIRNSNDNLHIDSGSNGTLYLNHYTAGLVYANGHRVWSDGYVGTYNYNDLSNRPTIPTIPSSLPANGGNADTLDNLDSSQFLRSDTADTMLGNLTIDNGTNTSIDVICDNGGTAIVKARGDSQGTGAFEVGQSTTYGGGFSYNGDGSPSLVSGETADHITFYRLDAGTRTEVFHYPYNSNVVNFNSTPTVGGVGLVKTNDTIAQSTNADTVDNLHAASFLRSDTDDTTTGSITISGSQSRGTYVSSSNYHSGADNLVLKGNSSGISSIFFESEKDGTNINHTSDFGFIQFHSYGTGTSGEANELIIGVSNDSDDHVILNAPSANGLKYRVGNSGTDNTVWHSGNDGASSGLDADLLDGQHGSYYLPTTGKASDSNLLDGIDSTYFNRGDQGYGVMVGTSGWNMNDLFTNRNRAGFFDVWGGSNFPPSTSHVHGMQVRHNSSAHYGWQLAGQYGQNKLWHRQVYNNTWGSWNQQWGSGNDGSGSGLDADLLDGQHASAFLTAETNAFLGDGGDQSTHPGTNRLIFTGQVSSGASALGMPTNDNSNAILNINRHSGEYNSQLGFSSVGSMFYRSFSAAAINSSTTWRKVWDAGNDGSGSGLDADYLDGLDLHNTQSTQNNANKVLRTQVNGYTMLGWINTTSGATSSTLNRVYCSEDGYIRYQTPANFGASISPHINYNNIANKPTIPVVGTANINIVAGTGLTGGGSFSANQSNNTTITLNATGSGGGSSSTVKTVKIKANKLNLIAATARQVIHTATVGNMIILEEAIMFADCDSTSSQAFPEFNYPIRIRVRSAASDGTFDSSYQTDGGFTFTKQALNMAGADSQGYPREARRFMVGVRRDPTASNPDVQHQITSVGNSFKSRIELSMDSYLTSLGNIEPDAAGSPIEDFYFYFQVKFREVSPSTFTGASNIQEITTYVD